MTVTVTRSVVWGGQSRTITLNGDDGSGIDARLTRVVLMTGEGWDVVRDTFHRALIEYPEYSPLRIAKALWYHARLTERLFDEWDAPLENVRQGAGL